MSESAGAAVTDVVVVSISVIVVSAEVVVVSSVVVVVSAAVVCTVVVVELSDELSDCSDDDKAVCCELSVFEDEISGIAAQEVRLSASIRETDLFIILIIINSFMPLLVFL